MSLRNYLPFIGLAVGAKKAAENTFLDSGQKEKSHPWFKDRKKRNKKARIDRKRNLRINH